MKVIVLSALVALAAAIPAPDVDMACRAEILGAGFSANFNETIAHTIHSMTVQGLQMFNPAATVENRVPTVNMDRSSAFGVVPFAPNDLLGNDFDTPTMNAIDKILTSLGTNTDGLGPMWSPLERVVHKFHMLDVWQRVFEVYESEVVGAPPSDLVCDCLMDAKHNGIYHAVLWVSDHYDSGTPITLLNRPIPQLEDAEAWQVWKERLLHYYTPNALLDSARYMYCATKDF